MSCLEGARSGGEEFLWESLVALFGNSKGDFLLICESKEAIISLLKES
ncbi:hypothetical protein [Helicobacter marmotae]|nr:hypothetical protein [Helicobacter marmotae]